MHARRGPPPDDPPAHLSRNVTQQQQQLYWEDDNLESVTSRRIHESERRSPQGRKPGVSAGEAILWGGVTETGAKQGLVMNSRYPDTFSQFNVNSLKSRMIFLVYRGQHGPLTALTADFSRSSREAPQYQGTVLDNDVLFTYRSTFPSAEALINVGLDLLELGCPGSTTCETRYFHSDPGAVVVTNPHDLVGLQPCR